MKKLIRQMPYDWHFHATTMPQIRRFEHWPGQWWRCVGVEMSRRQLLDFLTFAPWDTSEPLPDPFGALIMETAKLETMLGFPLLRLVPVDCGTTLYYELETGPGEALVEGAHYQLAGPGEGEEAAAGPEPAQPEMRGQRAVGVVFDEAAFPEDTVRPVSASKATLTKERWANWASNYAQESTQDFLQHVPLSVEQAVILKAKLEGAVLFGFSLVTNLVEGGQDVSQSKDLKPGLFQSRG